MRTVARVLLILSCAAILIVVSCAPDSGDRIVLVVVDYASPTSTDIGGLGIDTAIITALSPLQWTTPSGAKKHDFLFVAKLVPLLNEQLSASGRTYNIFRAKVGAGISLVDKKGVVVFTEDLGIFDGMGSTAIRGEIDAVEKAKAQIKVRLEANREKIVGIVEPASP